MTATRTPAMDDDAGVTDDWDDRVRALWASTDEADPEELLRRMRSLVDERPPGDGRAMYEWASVHDLLGREEAAVPLYEAALRAGLDDEHAAQAVVQLASSLRNTGRADAAIDLLRAAPDSPVVGAAPQAFLALALHAAGRADEALRVALLALAPTLPLYSGAVARYAAELGD